MSSSNAVADIRHIFNEKHVGHTGTLDPGAAGVLPICLGRAAKLFDYLSDKRKEYIAGITFGASTDTLDAYGALTQRSQARADISRAALEGILPRFCGDITQVAPMYSAVCHDGRKLYKLAREGITVPRKERTVNIGKLEILSDAEESESLNRYGSSFTLLIECSRGTYIRTLCQDIGDALGAPAYMSFLIRTRSGDFTLDTAYTVSELERLKEAGRLCEALLPPDAALSAMPEMRFNELSARKKKHLLNGAEIACEELNALEDNVPHRLYVDNEFIGISQKCGELAHIVTYLTGSADDGK